MVTCKMWWLHQELPFLHVFCMSAQYFKSMLTQATYQPYLPLHNQSPPISILAKHFHCITLYFQCNKGFIYHHREHLKATNTFVLSIAALPVPHVLTLYNDT